MDLLMTAVVDITTLVAACHALRSGPAEGSKVLPRKQRSRLRRDIKRGTVAYIDVLARSKRGMVDDALLAKCRIAAESQMPHALANQEVLGRLMASEAGSLAGLAAARQDLWRLAHLAIHLSAGMAAVRESEGLLDAKKAGGLARRLRRRLRKALIAYAQAALRTRSPDRPLILDARKAALVEIGPRGATEAERLADVEAGAHSGLTRIRRGVTKPLFDLAHDWRQRAPEPG